MRILVLHQLSRRFGPLPDSITQRINAIDSTNELTDLADRLLAADSLEELGLQPTSGSH